MKEEYTPYILTQLYTHQLDHSSKLETPSIISRTDSSMVFYPHNGILTKQFKNKLLMLAI